jgi:hypothetical protein
MFKRETNREIETVETVKLAVVSLSEAFFVLHIFNIAPSFQDASTCNESLLFDK